MRGFRAVATWVLLTAAGLAAPAAAQTPPASGGPVDRAVLEDLVVANRILGIEGVLDVLGHVSVRHPHNPNRYLMARSRAPALVTADDIMEYDLESNPVDQRGRPMFTERYIHGEVYKARPDVMAVVHSHAPTVIPFSVTQVPLRPVLHTAAFLSRGVPVFELRNAGGMTDMLVRNPALGKALAETLGDKNVALIRGHGDVVVAANLPLVVLRAIYTEVNARMQLQALSLGGPVTYIDPAEAALAEARQAGGNARFWEAWKAKVAATK